MTSPEVLAQAHPVTKRPSEYSRSTILYQLYPPDRDFLLFSVTTMPTLSGGTMMYSSQIRAGRARRRSPHDFSTTPIRSPG